MCRTKGDHTIVMMRNVLFPSLLDKLVIPGFIATRHARLKTGIETTSRWVNQ